MMRYLLCTFYLSCAAVWFYGWLTALHSQWAFATLAVTCLLTGILCLFAAQSPAHRSQQ